MKVNCSLVLLSIALVFVALSLEGCRIKAKAGRAKTKTKDPKIRKEAEKSALVVFTRGERALANGPEKSETFVIEGEEMQASMGVCKLGATLNGKRYNATLACNDQSLIHDKKAPCHVKKVEDVSCPEDMVPIAAVDAWGPVTCDPTGPEHEEAFVQLPKLCRAGSDSATKAKPETTKAKTARSAPVSMAGVMSGKDL